MDTILILEDDEVLLDGLAILLSGAGFRPLPVNNPEEAEKKIPEADLCILDIMLKEGSGLELLKKMRKTDSRPVLLLSALDSEEEIIEGLNAGADDYITKPFRSGELIARIHANLRHKTPELPRDEAVSEPEKKGLSCGGLFYALPEERFYRDGKELALRKQERQLLLMFFRSGGRILRRDYILQTLWDDEGLEVEENTLSVQISRLRRQIGRFHGEEYIETVWGIGYRLRIPVT